jgi:hypothetical protein
VLEGGDKEIGRDMRDIAVEQDLDQSPEGPKASLTNEGKPRIINSVFLKNMQSLFAMIVHYVLGVELKP